MEGPCWVAVLDLVLWMMPGRVEAAAMVADPGVEELLLVMAAVAAAVVVVVAAAVVVVVAAELLMAVAVVIQAVAAVSVIVAMARGVELMPVKQSQEGAG